MSHCGYCHLIGHNKCTCPKLTAKLKERAEAAIAAGGPDSWVVEQYKERIAPKKKKGQKLSNMVCGYCLGVGHTRRKCEVMERDKVIYEKHHNMVLRVARDYISSCPIGIGSLFSQSRDVWTDTGYEKKERKLVVVGFDISSDLMVVNPRPWLEMIDFLTGEKIIKSLQAFTSGRGDISYYNPVRLISAEASPIPDDWVEKKMVRIEMLAKHRWFKRSGNKSDDHRGWAFSTIERNEKYTPDSLNYSEALANLAAWSEKSIRENIIKLHTQAMRKKHVTL